MEEATPAGRLPIPLRGEVWWVDFGDPKGPGIKGHEQGAIRPAVVLSANELNQARPLVTVAPLTRTIRRSVRTHILVEPPDGGITRPCVVMCDQLRTVSTERLDNRAGLLAPATLVRVEKAVRIVLAL
jgi:mRNA interferase MazF